MRHECREVQQAIVRLADALCQWERDTGIESVLILREERGFVFRAANGKPNVAIDILDGEFLHNFLKREQQKKRQHLGARSI